MTPDDERAEQERTEAASPATYWDRLGQLARRGPELARIVAANPGAPPGLLRRIARGDDRALRELACVNPGTPSWVAHRLARDMPEVFATSARAAAMLRPENARTGVFPRACTLHALMGCAPLREAWTAQAVAHPYPSVRLALIKALPVEPAAQEVVLRLTYDRDARVRAAAVTALRAMDLPTAQRLARDESKAVLGALALHVSIPAEVKLELSRHADPHVRYLCVFTHQLPPAELARLARDANPSVRSTVARRAETPVSALRELASDADQWVRSSLAANPATPTDVLREAALGLDENMWIARYLSILTHRSMTAELSAAFFEQGAPRVRQLVAAAAIEVSPELLERFASDPDALVRCHTARRVSLPTALIARIAADSNDAVRAALAENAQAGAAVLSALARDGSPRVRAAVASNTATPRATLVALGRDPDVDVRSRVGRNKGTPAELAREIEKDPAVHAHRHPTYW